MSGVGRLDGLKIFLVGLLILVVALGAGILYASHKVGQYQETIELGRRDYKLFLERCFEVKQNEERANAEKIDLNNPIEFVYSQVTAAGIDHLTVKCNPSGADLSNIRKGYQDEKIEVGFQAPVSREKLAKFLYNIESNSAILKTHTIQIPKAPPDDKSDEWKNVKVTLAYRKPYVRK